uniref:Uncharacterized protein n=1 Tax=viral metagenome TaxID=1070528 RepID=A0A6C0LYG6_9ZZZZ
MTLYTVHGLVKSPDAIISSYEILNDRTYSDKEVVTILREMYTGDGVLLDHLLETPESKRMTLAELDTQLDAISSRNLWRRCANAGCV